MDALYIVLVTLSTLSVYPSDVGNKTNVTAPPESRKQQPQTSPSKATSHPPTSTTFHSSLTTPTTTTTTASATTSTRPTSETTTTVTTETTPAHMNMCRSSEIIQGLNWGPVAPGRTQIQKCPSDCEGQAMWTCGQDGHWLTPYPDMSNCSAFESDWTQAVTQLNGSDSAYQVMTSLAARIMKKESRFQAGDVKHAIQVLSMSLKMQKSQYRQCMSYRNPKKCEEESRTYTEASLNMSGASLGATMAWLTNSEMNQMASDFFLILEHVGFQATEAAVTQRNYYTDNIYFTPKSCAVGNVTRNNLQYSFLSGSIIILPESSVKDGSVNDTWTATFFTFYKMHYILGSNMQMNDYMNMGQNLSGIVVSVPIGTSLGLPGRSVRFSSGKARLVLKHVYSPTKLNLTGPRCMFWDVDQSLWSDHGCYLVSWGEDSSMCECNHLTNMAVLMDYAGVIHHNSRQFESAVTVITNIGSCISIVCLIVAEAIFAVVRSSGNMRITIHIHLCATILISQAIFLAGFDATDNPAICKSVAISLHYFFLSSFCWMLIEGYQLYVVIIKVFDTTGFKKRLFYLTGYGIPLVIVGLSATIRWDGYATPEYCWLSYSDGLIWAFLGPVAAILLVNLTIMVVTLQTAGRAMRRMEGRAMAMRSPIVMLKGCMSLMVILGVTWLFGILLFAFVWSDVVTRVLEVAFAIMNSLQGAFIFIFHCVCQRDVRNTFKRKVEKKLQLKTQVSITLTRTQTRRNDADIVRST